MARCGAFDKFVLKSLSQHRSLFKLRLRVLPVPKILIARASTSRSLWFAPPTESQILSNNAARSVDTRMMNTKPQNGTEPAPALGWRPYRGRWNAKVAFRDEPSETAGGQPATNDNQTSRRGRRRRNQRFPERISSTGSQGRQPGRSLSPRRDLSSQTPYDPNWVSTSNGLPDLPMMNPFTGLGDFPIHASHSAGFTNQLPFQQLLQLQFPQRLEQPLPNSPFFPILNGGIPFPAMPTFLPPAAFMDLDVQTQLSSEQIVHSMQQTNTPPQAGFSAAAASGQTQSPPAPPVNTHREAVKAPQPPSATKRYLDQSSQAPRTLPSPQPLLVILDLNGTLIYRKSGKFPPSFVRRAGLEEFLKTLVEKYKVMIWSSSTPTTVAAVCEKIFSKAQRKQLVVEWGRDRLGLTKAEYKSKIQVYKTLETVWSSKEVQASYPRKPKLPRTIAKKARPWDQTNTILIDDSKLKALSEPYNHIEIPEFSNAPGIDESIIFPKVLQRLEILAKCDDVSKMLRSWDTTSNGKNVLDLDVSSHYPSSSTAAGDVESTRANPEPELDPAQARKLRRKARKAEKKAARRLAAISAAQASSALPQTESQTEPPIPVNMDSKQQSHPRSSCESNPSEALKRSPSPASSAQSENFLLDRLEESLDL
ncbi:NLI interacting factor-like phosphatase-domain-containing protein [Aspergillus egyptiacus]|nr:NLI interacting factor-like phosphatase-domain-containing protein [Aspergillus egyptiacus]